MSRQLGDRVDPAKLERYAYGIAQEIAKAPKRGPFGRGSCIRRLVTLVRYELAKIEAGDADSNGA